MECRRIVHEDEEVSIRNAEGSFMKMKKYLYGMQKDHS